MYRGRIKKSPKIGGLASIDTISAIQYPYEKQQE